MQSFFFAAKQSRKADMEKAKTEFPTEFSAEYKGNFVLKGGGDNSIIDSTE